MSRGEDTRDRVLQAARRLFGERGFAPVTVREIAAEAGVSAAMVMKVGGSKRQLFAEAAPLEPAPLGPDTPLEGLGELLVRRLLDRREQDAAEPWLRAVYLVHDSPDPEQARREFRDRFLSRFAGADDEDGRRRADLLACMMVGLAAGTRTFRLAPAESTDREAVIREYGALLQRLIDGIPDPAPHPRPGGEAEA